MRHEDSSDLRLAPEIEALAEQERAKRKPGSCHQPFFKNRGQLKIVPVYVPRVYSLGTIETNEDDWRFR